MGWELGGGRGAVLQSAKVQDQLPLRKMVFDSPVNKECLNNLTTTFATVHLEITNDVESQIRCQRFDHLPLLTSVTKPGICFGRGGGHNVHLGITGPASAHVSPRLNLNLPGPISPANQSATSIY